MLALFRRHSPPHGNRAARHKQINWLPAECAANLHLKLELSRVSSNRCPWFEVDRVGVGHITAQRARGSRNPCETKLKLGVGVAGA